MLLTKIIIVATVVIILLIDLALLAFNGKQSTISAVIWEWSHRQPIIPFLGGALAAHLWWSAC